MRKRKVLFLCVGNSARSQMGEAFLREYGGDRFEAYSAGLEPKGIHPLTVKVMSEVGIDISSQRSKSVMEYAGQVHFGYLVPVCAEAEKGCPSFPGLGEKMLWPFEDPAAATGTEEEILQKFRQIRDQISTRVKNWLEEQKDTL